MSLTAFILLVLTLGTSAPAWAEEDFLLPDQAFQISGSADAPDRVTVAWDIADGYYLYRSKLKLRSRTVGIETGRPATPEGEIRKDEFFGEVEIYRNRVEVQLPLQRAAGAEDILTLEATSQGCADAGLCYPPHKQTILLELPKLAAADTPPKPQAAPTPQPTAETSAPTAEPEAEPGADALAELNQSLGLGGAEDDFLPPEEAFRVQAEVTGPDRLQLTWDIADGTYLYQEKLSLALEDAEGVAIGPYELPQAEIKEDSVRPDGSIGDVAVYHHLIDLTLPLLRAAAEPTSVTLVAKYQGCAERGICYPPQTRRIKLDLPAAAAVTALPASASAQAPAATEAADAGPVSEQDRIAAVLAGGSLWAAVALFYGFGLLLALTPCVFPMIPILSGIIAGQGAGITTGRAFVLSLVYVLAMALTYALVGVLAGLGGANIQAAFQNPWVLTAFALVFVALALSMFGFYELQLPSSLQSKITELSNRQQGGTLIGVAIMGVLSALIVGPCVAPPLAGALIFIGQTGDGWLGFAALLALGLGMGTPLLAIGTSAGKLLPRAGGWMDAVKAVFGVGLLAVAIVLMERVVPAAVAMVLWAILLICSAVYMGAVQPLPADAGGWRKLWKGLGLVLLAYGVLMLVGAAAGGKDTVQPLRGLALGGGAGTEEHVAFRRIKTAADLDRALAAARAAGRPVMLDFYADWCVSCKEMERYTFSDPAVAKEMARFELLQADVTANDVEDQALMQGRFGIPGPPAILFFDRDGRELRAYRVVGFKPAAEFADQLRRAVP
jgi:thiol:disulfide interchange protein DsbD